MWNDNVARKIIVTVLLEIYLSLVNIHPYECYAFEDRYTEKVSTFQVTVPRKVSEEGTFITHYIPHFFDAKRKKRDLVDDQVHYIIPVDGVDHHVHLWPYNDFLGPGLVVEKHSLVGNTTKINLRKPLDTHCYYRGVVRGIDGSKAALSTCYGLAGHVFIPDGEFFIEPSLDENRSEEYHKHYIYKRENINKAMNKTNCGTKGKFKEAWLQRMEWERKYGKQIEKSVNSNFFDVSLLEKPSNRSKREECDNPTTCPNQNDFMCLIDTPHFLEVLITLDSKLEREFTRDIETFIFTVFNMVSSNFLDGTIGSPIHLSLVRLIYLGYTIPRLDVLRLQPGLLLQNFCDWQLELNPLLESHPNHHDFAIFITRFEPCQGHILGLTNMASVCRLDKACTVVSAEGLLLSNIITHQIGHSLGADHDDGNDGGCTGEEPDGTRYHMIPFISQSSSAWSVCSKQFITNFVTSRMSWCIVDSPNEHDFKDPNILPGQVYDAIHQCSLNFNMQTLACKTDNFCRTLYCQISPNKCATTGDPPAAGTDCAQDMWCFHGSCVHRGRRPGAVHGEWGPWSQWSSCTRSCGGGVQQRIRACDNPAPTNGGKHCFGNWITHRICSSEPCIGLGTPSFLDLQCRMTNKRPYKGHHYLWDHFRAFFEEMKCTLVCINEKSQISIRSPVVVDGSPCQPGTNNVCIQGKCRHVGCDYVIDSKAKNDMCGICHGNGTGCKVVHGVFTDTGVEDVVPFLKLPVRTSMIYIIEMNPSNCYFMIGNSLTTTYYLNDPNESNHMPGQFSVGNTRAIYEEKVDAGRVFIKDPIDQPITVSLKCRKSLPGKGFLRYGNPGIHYQYALPESDPTYIATYRWAYLTWDECTRICNGGSQRAVPACVEVKGGEVDDRYCSTQRKPEVLVRTCNSQPCLAKWWAGSWSACDCRDGEGIMTRVVLCMKPEKEDNSITRVVQDKECCFQPKPRLQKPCNEDKDTPKCKREVVSVLNEEVVKSDYNPSYFYNSEIHGNEDNNDRKIHRPLKAVPQSENPQQRLDILESVDMDNDIIESPKKPPKKLRKRKKLSQGRNKVQSLKKTTTGAQLSTEDNGECTTNASLKLKTTTSTTTSTITSTTVDDTRDDTECTTSDMMESTGGDTDTDKSSQVGVDNYTWRSTTTRQMCGVTDFFLEHIFRSTKYLTSCSPDDTEIMEPADLGPRLDSSNSSLYKMVVVPIIKDSSNSFPKGDIEWQVFGDSVYLPVAYALNKTLISGSSIIKVLQEARRRGTEPPVILADLT